MQLTLTVTGEVADIASVLAFVESRRITHAIPVNTSTSSGLTPYVSPRSGKVVTLNLSQFAEFYQGVSAKYKTGIRMLADKGVVSCEDLIAAGIPNPGHFKSRTSLRAKTVLALSRPVQFAWYSSKPARGAEKWYLEVPAKTRRSMQAYFAGKSGA